jgi:hypothetical protein
MRKFILVFLILLIPAFAFAEARVGPVAFLNFPLIQDEQLDVPDLQKLNVSDFSFGADFRLKLAIFQASAMALFTPGLKEVNLPGKTVPLPPSADVFLDGGIAIDITKVRLGLGIGPNFSFFFGNSDLISDPVSAGINLKATADIVLGSFSIGLIYLTQFDMDLDEAAQILSADKTKGLFGVAALFEL